MLSIAERPDITYRTTEVSETILARTMKSIAGGDSSSMRVLPYHLPLVAAFGLGSRLWDVDGNEYIDLNMAYGPLIFGHRNPDILKSVVHQLTSSGSQLGFPAEINLRVAEKIKALFPSMELMRFANSGTEANASAIRLARAVTGRQKLILFEGHYHGWSEAVFHRYHAATSDLPKEGFGQALPGTAGMSLGQPDAIVVRWNDLDSLDECLRRYGKDAAACIMEPIMANAGVIPPRPGYLKAVRELTQQYGILLIFDEVITGLRVAAGGAQEYYGVRPDITIISKALGGGFPVAAFGGSKDIMAPLIDRSVFHGGVYSSNATVMAAAEAVLDQITSKADDIYGRLFALGDALSDGLKGIFKQLGRPAVVQHVGPMLSLFLTNKHAEAIYDYRQARELCDSEGYISLQHALQRCGVYFHPNLLEPMYVSTAHSNEDIAIVLERVEDAARSLMMR
jgi:glutamate-1-semialdehyde 2,1-aminomutase